MGNEIDSDPLAPAKGIAAGVLASLCVYALIAVVIAIIWRWS